MLKRRNFLKTSGALVLGSMVAPKLLGAELLRKPHPIGLQLYTLFNVMTSDVKEHLQQVEEIGYRELESAFSKLGPFYGYTPKEFKSLVNSLGMSWKSHHVLGAPFKLPPGTKMPNGPDGKPIKLPPMKNLKENMQELVDQAAEGGIPYLVCANIPTYSGDEIKSSVEILNKTGELCRKANITLAYHNHTEEFEKTDGEIPYDVFLRDLTPDIKMELDLCWATKAGVDPVALFKAHPGRFPLWHVKDLDKDRKGPAPVGDGVIDFKRIFENASVAGMKHFFVEHDMPKDPFASITESFHYLRNTLKV
ncbi:MAG: sugar phosphate isomerase/epimerase [Bacteroidota bacterium]|nr:sugar phosphate isomerase/epimerase [Bacteroidota bacterium]